MFKVRFSFITKYQKTASASINGSYNIIDVNTATVKKMENFTGKFNFSCEWGKYSGDERAISRNSRYLVNKAEQFAPIENEMVIKASYDLAGDLANTLKSYAR